MDEAQRLLSSLWPRHHRFVYEAMPEGLRLAGFRLGFPDIDRLTANGKDFSLTLEMTIRESDVS